MSKRIIHLTESNFKTLVSESVESILNEIGYRTSALPHGANNNAMQSELQNSDSNAVGKMDSSNQKRMSAITLSIHDTFPNMVLNFIERDKANQYYSVVFHFNEMMTMNDERFVMKGDIEISGRGRKQGYIEFNFQQQSFYRVNFYGKCSIRRIYTLMIDNDYRECFTSVLSFISNVD